MHLHPENVGFPWHFGSTAFQMLSGLMRFFELILRSLFRWTYCSLQKQMNNLRGLPPRRFRLLFGCELCQKLRDAALLRGRLPILAAKIYIKAHASKKPGPFLFRHTRFCHTQPVRHHGLGKERPHCIKSVAYHPIWRDMQQKTRERPSAVQAPKAHKDRRKLFSKNLHSC